MVNQEYYTLGTAPSVIRQLFAYGLEQAKVVGPENVYDYSLGNPSIPAPKKVNESIKKIVDETDSIKLHGYSMAPGFEEARAAVAKDLAVSKEACHHKHYTAPGAGDADILLVPNYEVGNGIGKAASLFGNAKNAGIILGAKVPIVLVSRADSAESKLASIAAGSVLAQRMELN